MGMVELRGQIFVKHSKNGRESLVLFEINQEKEKEMK